MLQKNLKYAMGIILGNTYAMEFVKNLAKNYCIMHSIVLEKKRCTSKKKGIKTIHVRIIFLSLSRIWFIDEIRVSCSNYSYSNYSNTLRYSNLEYS